MFLINWIWSLEGGNVIDFWLKKILKAEKTLQIEQIAHFCFCGFGDPIQFITLKEFFDWKI